MDERKKEVAVVAMDDGKMEEICKKFHLFHHVMTFLQLKFRY